MISPQSRKRFASHDRFLLAVHENPDGDALGSLLAAKLTLDALGKDSVMFLPGQAPLPAEYKFMPLEEVRRELPDDVEERVLFALDCANESRLGPGQEAIDRAPLVLNVDHHHDNSRFGNVNLVVADASSTGEIVRDLLDELGVELTPELAEAIYIALVTDTGRFQYANTTPKALRLAAELVEAGADVHRVFQSIYESVQLAKLKLLARALERAQVYEGGGIVVSYLLKTDFAEVGAAEPYSEGIIDFLRAVEGADMAALIREPPAPGRPARRISLRSSSDELDVSAIARASGDGGGHRQAAGFSSSKEIPEIVEFIREQYAGGPCRRAGLIPRGSSSSTSRRARRPSPSSATSASAPARARAMPGRSIPSRRGSCSCCWDGSRRSRTASSASTSGT